MGRCMCGIRRLFSNREKKFAPRSQGSTDANLIRGIDVFSRMLVTSLYKSVPLSDP